MRRPANSDYSFNGGYNYSYIMIAEMKSFVSYVTFDQPSLNILVVLTLYKHVNSFHWQTNSSQSLQYPEGLQFMEKVWYFHLVLDCVDAFQ